MCGITGIFNHVTGQNVSEDILAKMNDELVRRGPDESGIFLDGDIGLGHRRLSIIDLSSGRQPMTNEDGAILVVYNGEIYNFMALRSELAEAGHLFRTRCDTEVIVHAWEEWGEDCVNRFRGMFAFAIWDRNRRSLFLARDRLGIKPLYYAVTEDGDILFASELKAILKHSGVRRNFDCYAIEDYFAYGYIPDPRTIFTSVWKLPPGHTLTVTRGSQELRPRKYWDLTFSPDNTMTESDWCEGLKERLREAVKIRMIADVPLGAFLSGGIDSSAVVAMMAGLSSEPVRTCSISFDDERFDESRYAEEIASLYGTRHHVERVAVDDFSLLPKLSEIYDEPFADSSALPTYSVCRLARKYVKVALSGDGGDENLAGYRRYKWFMNEERVRSIFPQSIRRPLFGFLGMLYPKADWAPKVFRAKSTFEALSRDSIDSYFHSITVLKDNLRNELYSCDFKKDLSGYNAAQVLHQHARMSPADPLSMVQYLDIKTYLTGDILTKVDRASMANSLEVRVPLLDHLFVEWLATMPSRLKLKDGEGKYIFKKSLDGNIPKSILYRRKMGFAVPLCRWFRFNLREHVRDSLLGSTLLETGLFEKKTLAKIIHLHETGVRDFSAPIWALLMFESFCSRYMR